ncbi:DUF882 domain-containing protein [Alsobacter sp. KACC 23698]|uniref:Murein endopeptidase K n=1 Tax=Alsobacter sp. KACC 23698 TaxID=3149229 RepID=A0AAU7JCQ6_9HYPH
MLGETGNLGDAVANGDTRAISIYHTHSKESATITFKRNGVYDRDGLEKLNWILRDWRRDEPTSMDPRLFDIAWEVYRETGSQEPINIVSAYRAPETNAMLRRRSRAVAKHSQHMLGKAMDFYLPDASMAKVREIALRLQRGGVGYYPTAYNPFVHLDAGSVRHWPRLSRDQLTRLFPDGKTVHMPTDGKPMPRYEEAAAEVVANGGTVFAYAGGENEEGPAPVVASRRGKSFFAALFGIGGGEDEDEDLVQAPRGRGGRVASRPPPQAQAYAPSATVDDRFVGAYATRAMFASAAPAQPVRAAIAPRPAPAPAPQVEDEAPGVQERPIVVGSLGPAGAAVIEPTPSPAPAPVAPKLVDVPQPLIRPTALLPAVSQPQAAPPQPQMVWQAGPAGAPGQSSPVGAADAAPRFAAVPLPLARPADLGGAIASATPAALLTVANVPLPPSRPIALASLVPMIPASLPAGTPALAAPETAPRSVEPARRAHQEPVAARETARDASAHPSPEPSEDEALDRDGLKSLFAGASVAGAARPGVAPKAPSVSTAKARPTQREIAHAAANPVATVAMNFSHGPNELTTDRFSGPAVKPLGSARFTPAR